MSVTSKGVVGGGVKCASLSSVSSVAIGRGVQSITSPIIFIIHMESSLDMVVGWLYVGHFNPIEAPFMGLDIWQGRLVNWLCLYYLTLAPMVSRA